MAVPLVIWTGGKIVSIRHNSDRLARLGRQAPQPTALKYDFFYTEQASKWKELSFFVCQRVNLLWEDWDVGDVGQ